VYLNILCLFCINLHYTSVVHVLKGCKHFVQRIMVYVAVHNFEIWPLPGAKINSAYYYDDECDHILEKGFLIHHLSNNDLLCQQDRALWLTVLSLTCAPICQSSRTKKNDLHIDFIGGNYSLWGVLQQMVYRRNISDTDHLLDSAKPRHIKLSDWSAAKRLMMVIKAKDASVELCQD